MEKKKSKLGFDEIIKIRVGLYCVLNRSEDFENSIQDIKDYFNALVSPGNIRFENISIYDIELAARIFLPIKLNSPHTDLEIEIFNHRINTEDKEKILELFKQLYDSIIEELKLNNANLKKCNMNFSVLNRNINIVGLDKFSSSEVINKIKELGWLESSVLGLSKEDN